MMWLLIVVAAYGSTGTFQPFQLKSECEAVREFVAKKSNAIAVCMEVQNVYRGGRP